MSDGSQQDQRAAWVRRVLGVDVTGGATPDRGELAQQRLAICRDDIGLIAKDPAAADLSRRADEIAALLASGDTTAVFSLLDALETAIAEARRAATLTAATAESGHRVAYGKLLLDWRKAQTETVKQLQAFGAKVLTDAGVKADPRFAEVGEVVATFTDSVPKFGTELENALNDLDRQASKADLTEQLAATRGLVDRYLSLLDGARDLSELREIAREKFGVVLNDDLQDVLNDLLAALNERV
jgi:hypothetical protein